MRPASAGAAAVSAGILDGLYERYGETRPHHPVPRRAADLLAGREAAFRKRFAPLLPAARSAKILDLGCGYGEFLYFLQQAGYSRACGVDLDAGQVRTAQRLGVRNVLHADARHYLAAARDFDFISALDVLEHFAKSQVVDILASIHKALAPGGRFLCQVPNLAAFYTPLFFMDFTHQTPFTASSLKQALEMAGFANVRVYAMGPVAHGVRSAVRCVLWKGMAAGLRAIQTIEGGPRHRTGSIFTAVIAASGDRL
jgi:SAM-dependent methyltransferase